jgi:hypothetical protein
LFEERLGPTTKELVGIELCSGLVVQLSFAPAMLFGRDEVKDEFLLLSDCKFGPDFCDLA